MVFFFGPEYSRSAGTLAILFWYSCFGFLSTFLVNLLIICGKQIVDVWISFALILLNVGMNFVLIPPYSHYGAALATVLTEIFGLAFMMTYAARQREIRLPFPKQELGLTLKLNFIFLGILAGLKAFPLPFYFFIPIAAASYGALILAMKIVSVEDCKNYLASALKNLSGLAS
jgi:O-antigen/teichoic acid export membrane protein